MIKLLSAFVLVLKCIRYLPLMVIFKIYDKNKSLSKEREYWYKNATFVGEEKGGLWRFIGLLDLREYRSVLYYRIGVVSKLIQWLAPGQCALNFHCWNIGNGLVIQHGHSTQIFAVSIGERCQIWQNVTIGKNRLYTDDKPIIGNNVKICAGAIVIGDITIGDNVTIGAGSVVVKSIPSDSVVVGNPARIIKKQIANV